MERSGDLLDVYVVLSSVAVKDTGPMMDQNLWHIDY